jgi:UDP-N-acetyl-D-mannosaminuronate dehydrogenase
MQKAEEVLLDVLRIDSKNVHSKTELGIVYREQKKYAKAEKWLEPLAQKGNIHGINELAILYRNWGIRNYTIINRQKVLRSKKWFLKAIELKKDNIQSYDGLAKILTILQEHKTAEKILLVGLSYRKNDFRLQKQLVSLAAYNLRNKEKTKKYLAVLKSNKRFKNRAYLEKIDDILNLWLD